MIYLASPYSHPDAFVREQRFQSACVAASELMRVGYVVDCPVAHGHSIAQHGLPTDWSYWERFNHCFLEMCDEVMVLTLDGWQKSDGGAGRNTDRLRVAKAGELL